MRYTHQPRHLQHSYYPYYASFYVGGVEKCGDTKHRKPVCACLSAHLARRFWFSFICFVGFNFLRLKSYGLRTGLLGDHFVLLFGRDWEIALWSQAIAQIFIPCQNQCLPKPGDKCEQVCVHVQACCVAWLFLALLNSMWMELPRYPLQVLPLSLGVWNHENGGGTSRLALWLAFPKKLG